MKSWMEFFKFEYPKLLSTEDEISKSFSGNQIFTPTPLPTSKSDSVIKRKLTKVDILKVKIVRKASIGNKEPLNLLQTTTLGRSLSQKSFFEDIPEDNSSIDLSTFVEEDEYKTNDICGPQDGFEDDEHVSPDIEVKKKKMKAFQENFIFNSTWPFEEDEIATCAAEILKKDPKYQTNEEKAYIIALEDYRKKLEEHMKKHKTKPIFNKATATCIFSIPKDQRSKKELEYTNDIELYLNHICKQIHYLPPDLYQRVIQDSVEIFNKPKEKRTEKEQLYVEKISMISREIYVQEIQTGLISQSTLLHDL